MIANVISQGMPTSDGTVEISWSINGDLLELSVDDAGEGGSLEPIDFDEDSLADAASRSLIVSPTAGGST